MSPVLRLRPFIEEHMWKQSSSERPNSYEWDKRNYLRKVHFVRCAALMSPQCLLRSFLVIPLSRAESQPKNIYHTSSKRKHLEVKTGLRTFRSFSRGALRYVRLTSRSRIKLQSWFKLTGKKISGSSTPQTSLSAVNRTSLTLVAHNVSP